MASIPRSLIDNPVARAELSHQQRSAEQRKWRRWPTIFALGLGVALFSNACLLLAPLVARAFGVPPDELSALVYSWFGTVTVLLAALIMAHHLSFATTAMQLSSTSISREKRGLTWESLLLTGMDARQIVYGKWWATMRTLWQTYRPLLILRFAVALWMGISGGQTRITPFAAAPPLLEILLIGIVTAIFPMCYAAFSVTLGLLASLLTRQENSAHRVGSLFQLGAVVASLCMILLSFIVPFTDLEPGLVSLVPALFVTPLDGGMLALIGISGMAASYYLIGVSLCCAFYAALTLVLLRVAQRLAVHQGVLPTI